MPELPEVEIVKQSLDKSIKFPKSSEFSQKSDSFGNLILEISLLDSSTETKTQSNIRLFLLRSFFLCVCVYL